jgi:hypothetical protein
MQFLAKGSIKNLNITFNVMNGSNNWATNLFIQDISFNFIAGFLSS